MKRRDALKGLDVNLFLLEMDRMQEQMQQTEANYKIADDQLKETSASYEKIKTEYETMETEIDEAGKRIDAGRERLNHTVVSKGKLEGQVNVLHEQVKAFEMSDEHFKNRADEIEQDRLDKLLQRQSYEQEKKMLDEQLAEVIVRRQRAEDKLRELQESISGCNAHLEQGKEELLVLLNQKAQIQAGILRCKTMIEQINIRKAELHQRLLTQKSEESGTQDAMRKFSEALDHVRAEMTRLHQDESQLLEEQKTWDSKLAFTDRSLEEETAVYHRTASRLESLKNIAERYDGYGASIQKVMEQKQSEPGLLGVVSDFIKTDSRYETAVETALGGSIRSIVTEDDQTAKKMIAYLKQNRLGRATFLPLTSVAGNGTIRDANALREPGVIGLASMLVRYEKKYDGIVRQLLGKIVVAETIDHAIALAKKYRHSLSIVTLEGEYLRPGGSMTGGAYKNSSNLLGRNREIEDLAAKLEKSREYLSEQKRRKEEITTARALLGDDLQKIRTQLQELSLVENTASLNEKRARQQQEEREQELQKLRSEAEQMDLEIAELKKEKGDAAEQMQTLLDREAEIAQGNQSYQDRLDEKLYLESSVNKAFSEVQMEEANIRQKSEFAIQNIRRVDEEIEKCSLQVQELSAEVEAAKEDAAKKKQEIVLLRQTIAKAEEDIARLQENLSQQMDERDERKKRQKQFFQKREEISGRMTELDKERFRLNSQKEKLEESREQQINYMWEEYELTPHSAKALKQDGHHEAGELKKQIAEIKESIRQLGNVNVNAIEEYREVSKRLTFLKAQHDDLVASEEALVKIIEDLDHGMRRQFTEKFQEIQREFDRAFKELFGGGKGTLQLVEEEDILETGIRIIAQPPGKKLQNMVLLSGGEKSLTAIALLFAIQNLKPSPFCLLDEIEAALDDSNVGRFATYLHKLTKNTQFIVITHRRGTMTAADRLYGITMQEKGVSTLVSVDLIEHGLTK